MKKLQDFAREMGVTDRMIQKHLRKYATELEGHYERKGPNGTWLDDEAQDIIRSKMRQAPVAIFEEDPRVNRQQKEIEDLREQLKKKDTVLYGLIDKNEALKSQLEDLKLLSDGKAEAEKKAADLELALTSAEKKAAESEDLAASIRKAKIEVEKDLEAVKKEAETAKDIAEANEQEAARAKSEAEALRAQLELIATSKGLKRRRLLKELSKKNKEK